VADGQTNLLSEDVQRDNVNARWISLPHATFAVSTGPDGRVVEAPPIARWAIGKPIEQVTGFYERKGAEVRDLQGDGTEPRADQTTADVHQHAWRDTGRMESHPQRGSQAAPQRARVSPALQPSTPRPSTSTVSPEQAEALHRHTWRDTGRLEKTCDGCQTIAFRARQPDGSWRTQWRATLAEQTRQRLANAGIDRDDPGLARIREYNASLGISPAGYEREAGQ